MSLFFRLLALLAVTLAPACGGGGGAGGTMSTPMGTLRLALTDAPACGFDRVYVTVEKVRIYQTDEAADADRGSADVVLSPPRRIDLLTLTGGVLEELGTTTLPAGHYRQLRLFLSSDSAGMANAVQPSGGGVLEPLDTPSAQQSGLKVRADFDVPVGQMADLVLDFDACKSVVSAGNSGKYILKPVVTARPRSASVIDDSERRVNTTTAGAQVQPRVAGFTDGGYVIVWVSPRPDNGALAIYSQRYAPNGTAVGGETLVSGDATTDQVLPSVAALKDGGYVIAWGALNSTGSGAGLGTAVYMQRFDADGTAAGTVQQVNGASMQEQTQPHVAALADGGYVVIWRFVQSTGGPFPGSTAGVLARRYDADGVAAGPEQTVSTNFGLTDSAVAALNDGGHVVVWSVTSPTTIYVYAQRFDAAGAALGAVRQVSDWGETPTVTALGDGGYLIMWRSLDGFVLAQRYHADGSPAGPPLRVDAASGQQGQPYAVSLAGGGYLLGWVASHADGIGKDIYAQRYGANDGVLGSITRINLTLASDQQSPAAAATPGGGVVVTWMSMGQDGDSWGIYARQLGASGLR